MVMTLPPPSPVLEQRRLDVEMDATGRSSFSCGIDWDSLFPDRAPSEKVLYLFLQRLRDVADGEAASENLAAWTETQHWELLEGELKEEFSAEADSLQDILLDVVLQWEMLQTNSRDGSGNDRLALEFSSEQLGEWESQLQAIADAAVQKAAGAVGDAIASNAEEAASDRRVAYRLSKLAALYKAQGKYERAEPFYREALNLYRQASGDGQVDVAIILNNLAELYRSQGKYGEAEPLYSQSLALMRRSLGDDHPDVATSLNNLAGLYQARGQYEQAEPLFVESLEMRQRLLGNDHPDVATSLNNLAVLYFDTERYGEAESLLAQEIAICTQRLGPDHPHTRDSQRNLEVVRQKLAERDRP